MNTQNMKLRNENDDNAIKKSEERQINGQKGAKQWVLLGAFLSFFGWLWYVSPIGIYPDSGSYIAMQTGREPLYPLFLLCFRLLFREADTLVWLAASGQLDSEKALSLIHTWPALNVSMLVQSILAAVACYYLTRTIVKIFDLKWGLTLLTAGCTLIPYVVTPLASSSHMVLNKAVLTEGLTFPLFMLFTALMIQGLLPAGGCMAERRDLADETAYRRQIGRQKRKYYGLGFICSFFLVLTRNQMLVTFAVWCVVIAYEIWQSRSWKGIVILVAAVALFLAGRTGFHDIYNAIAHQGYAGADTGNYNMLTTFLYLSDAKDAELIADAEKRELFLMMHQQMEAEGMTLATAPEGILNRAYHYEECYDSIGFQVQQPCLFAYAEQKGIPDGEVLNEVVRTAAEINSALLPAVRGAYISNYLATVASGFTRSVSASGFIMGVYSIFIYLLAVVLMVCLYKRNKRSRAALLMAFALMMICANVFATAIMIMCLSRYMIYNTALFYIAGLMCLRELYIDRKK